ncbi:MAG: hypothetical protein B6V02_01770 [Thermoprotei archaeon ex4572_64]|nr:MAG: hypothetical protein B6V02_01770 [Thermoprotei archaeon ex4572_64]
MPRTIADKIHDDVKLTFKGYSRLWLTIANYIDDVSKTSSDVEIILRPRLFEDIMNLLAYILPIVITTSFCTIITFKELSKGDKLRVKLFASGFCVFLHLINCKCD